MPEDRLHLADGANYERFMGRWSANVAEDFLGWLAQPNGLRWLDVGCGNGAFTEQIVARCAPSEVQGVDPSEGQLAYARSRSGIGNAQFRLGDAQALSFGNAEFDVAAMALVITAVPDQPRAIAEMRRVVRPGGCVAAYIWDVRGGGLPIEPVIAAMRSLGIAFPDLGDAGLNHLESLWQQAGLASIETRVIRIPITFADIDDFWSTNSAAGTPTGAAISKLSQFEREQLRARIDERISRDAEGRISYSAHANAIKGRV